MYRNKSALFWAGTLLVSCQIITACTSKAVVSTPSPSPDAKASKKAKKAKKSTDELRTHWIAYTDSSHQFLNLVNAYGEVPDQYKSPLQVESFKVSKKFIAYVSVADHHLYLLDAATGEKVKGFTPVADLSAGDLKLILEDDYQLTDRFLSYKTGNDIRVWDIKTGAFIKLNGLNVNLTLVNQSLKSISVSHRISDIGLAHNNSNKQIRLIDENGNSVSFFDQSGNVLPSIVTKDFLLTNQYLVALEHNANHDIHFYELVSKPTLHAVARPGILTHLPTYQKGMYLQNEIWISDKVLAYRDDLGQLVVIPAKTSLSRAYVIASSLVSAKVSGSRLVWEEKDASNATSKVYIWDVDSGKFDPKELPHDPTYNLTLDNVELSEYLIAVKKPDPANPKQKIVTILDSDLNPLKPFKPFKADTILLPNSRTH